MKDYGNMLPKNKKMVRYPAAVIRDSKLKENVARSVLLPEWLRKCFKLPEDVSGKGNLLEIMGCNARKGHQVN